MVAAAYVALFISSVPILFQRTSTLASPPIPAGVPAEPLGIALAQVGLTPETFAIYIVAADIIAFLIFAVIGLLILLRRSDEWIGIASSLVLIAFGAVATTSVDMVVNNLETQGSDSNSRVVSPGSASFLVIAALFNPMRQRIQLVIDRRLYRRKYNAARTLESFGATVRDEVDLSGFSGSLLDIVEQSVQPERVTLWLKE